ncbi:hypothetical protein [Pseudanabaena sp. FACHB-2040]|uniref:hypothetical protein n=1 Tax=Pseudanabaena sp. FACHB-2040 TaxID=2692859 RepID=UPI00168901CD|nr:hypothetical protein [Pseudanabaena sp. FACHB-2040]MBD0267935.1 hypothetical protein [Cyanobacteria bacterium Co-bin8]MBD2260665.1 hypothetical protein [Pseudanabaena sp. FACHB-2040]
MYTISLSPSMQLATLAAALAVGIVTAVHGQAELQNPVRLYTGFFSNIDDRGSGRVVPNQFQSNLFLPNYLLGFRGSGRISGDPKESIPSSLQKSPSTSSGQASTPLAYRGSGRINLKRQIAV